METENLPNWPPIKEPIVLNKKTVKNSLNWRPIVLNKKTVKNLPNWPPIVVPINCYNGNLAETQDEPGSRRKDVK